MLDTATPDQARRRRAKGSLPFCIWRSYTAIVLDVATGMRAEELRALLWKNVHRTGGFIRVMHGLDADGLLAVPKTDSSYPDIQVPPDVVEDLCRWREICPDTTPDALVFPTLTGTPMSHRGLLDQIWYPLLKDVGMKSKDGRYKYVFHGLRHFLCLDHDRGGFATEAGAEAARSRDFEHDGGHLRSSFSRERGGDENDPRCSVGSSGRATG